MGDTLPKHVMVLAGSGLLPYLGAAVMLAAGPVGLAATVAELLADYSFGIIAFLVGAWWGLTLIRRIPVALYLSNGVFLAAFFGHALLPVAAWLLMAAVLMLVIWWAEGWHRLFRPQPIYYRRVRGVLSVVAAGSLVASAGLAGG